MSRGGWRGGGRPKVHMDGVIKAHVLLTPEIDNLLDQLCDQYGTVRSETVRQLVAGAAKGCGLKPCAACIAAHPARCAKHG